MSNLTSTFLHPREERRPKRSPKKKPPSVQPVSGHAARERLIIGAKYASISLGVYLLGYFGYNFLIFVLAPVAAVAVAQQRKDERRRKVKCQIMRAMRVNLCGIFTVTESGVKAICSKLHADTAGKCESLRQMWECVSEPAVSGSRNDVSAAAKNAARTSVKEKGLTPKRSRQKKKHLIPNTQILLWKKQTSVASDSL